MSKVILITGCSTGIGRDLTQHLTQAGYTVVATARHTDALNNLQAALKLPLDVTQPDSIEEAVACTVQQFGRIDILVNNAGYALRGVLEEVSVEQVQQMFDVNVFGVLRLIQAVVPLMRKRGSGRIVNVSSISGKLAAPVNGTYSASKFALEALSDALRLELVPFGIQVVVIEPSVIKTHFENTARIHAGNILSNAASPYLPLYSVNDQFAAFTRRHEPGPEAVSRVIQQAIETPHPKARYLVAAALPIRLVIPLRDWVWDSLQRRILKIEPPLTVED
ncbi:MAG TPA: SDR family oxidoreductase [Anaerolineales bacterium]|nr:SDR family oxidoreductase [Anaerolineales bacterium]